MAEAARRIVLPLRLAEICRSPKQLQMIQSPGWGSDLRIWVHLWLLLKGYFSNKHQKSTSHSCFPCTSPTHPTSCGLLPSSMVHADFESTKEEKTVLAQPPDQLEVGCVRNMKNLFPGDLSSPTSSYCSVSDRQHGICNNVNERRWYKSSLSVIPSSSQTSPFPMEPLRVRARQLLSLFQFYFPWFETNAGAQAHLLIQGKAECMEMYSVLFRLQSPYLLS